ncbi:hypothetical protein NDU88_003362 [Pleurodeles waltl]|uniref:Secreted protein n=1 Tax=Pleurodeles waltl TaxID=8319 RepID=A0AAV7VDZ2_PLEWA|nr:hypothetical protein NDU88_003362 [Pleurodeles waltl]
MPRCLAQLHTILALFVDRLHHHRLAAAVVLHAEMPCSASHYSGSLSRLPPPSPPHPLLPLLCYVLRCLAQLLTLLALLVDPLHHRLLARCRSCVQQCLAQLSIIRSILALLINHLQYRLLTRCQAKALWTWLCSASAHRSAILPPTRTQTQSQSMMGAPHVPQLTD